MQTERDLLSRQKDPVVLGTYESDAFVLSLRRPDEFASTHSFGYHRTPHVGRCVCSSEPPLIVRESVHDRTVEQLGGLPRSYDTASYYYIFLLYLCNICAGVYGMEYSLALPMVLLSLPPTPRLYIISQYTRTRTHTHTGFSGGSRKTSSELWILTI